MIGSGSAERNEGKASLRNELMLSLERDHGETARAMGKCWDGMKHEFMSRVFCTGACSVSDTTQ